MIRAVIVDDEPPARRKLKHLLSAEPDFEVTGEAESAAAGIDVLNRVRPEVVFLDIGLPDASGFEVVEALPERTRLQIVFVTAFDEFAIKAFEVHALDYLLKPVEPTRFARATARIREIVQSRSIAAQVARRVDELVARVQAERPYAARLLIQDGGRSVFVDVERVDWIESARNYVVIHAGGETFVQRSTLDGLCARLDPARFRRISRTHVVNVARIAAVRSGLHGDRKVVLKGGVELGWSRRYRTESLQELQGL